VFSKPGFRVAWVAELGDRVNGGLAVVGDTVYVDSFDQSLYALDLPSGDIRWKAPADNVLMSTPVVAQNLVIVGSGHDGFSADDNSSQVWGRAEGDDVIAFDTRSGTRMWAYHTVGEDMPSPAIDGNLAVFANGDLHAYGLRMRDGDLLWRQRLSGVATMASTTIVDGVAYVSVCHNVPHFRETVAIKASNGRILWKNPNGSCDASPAFERGILFVDGNAEDGHGAFDPGGEDIVAAIDARTGRTIWRHVSPPGPYTLVASGEHAIAGTAVDGVLYQSIVNRDLIVAFDERTGRVLWRVSTLAPVKMSPVVTRNRVIFGDTAGVLYSVNASNGHIIRTAAFKDSFSTSPPVVVGETVLVASGRHVFAFPLNVL
jgi:outer membrane protein assembly factor BamB